MSDRKDRIRALSMEPERKQGALARYIGSHMTWATDLSAAKLSQ